MAWQPFSCQHGKPCNVTAGAVHSPLDASELLLLSGVREAAVRALRVLASTEAGHIATSQSNVTETLTDVRTQHTRTLCVSPVCCSVRTHVGCVILQEAFRAACSVSTLTEADSLLHELRVAEGRRAELHRTR